MNRSLQNGTASPPLPALREFIKAGAASLLGKIETVVITIPAPAAHPGFLLGASPAHEAFVWIPPEGACFSGVGAAHAVTAAGEDRLRKLREQSAAFWKTLAEIRYPGSEAMPPALFGGLAFEAGLCVETPWEHFDDGSFVL
ncbi:MAG: hypothetical protein ABIH26_15800, partial [Candidatus Eisenbacteria bacterium]